VLTPGFSALVAGILLGSLAVRVAIGSQLSGEAHAAGIRGAAPASVVSTATDGSAHFQEWALKAGRQAFETGGRSFWAVLGSTVDDVRGAGRFDIPDWSRQPLGAGGISLMVKIGESTSRWVHTNATNVWQLLAAMEVSIQPGDQIVPAPESPLSAAMAVSIVRMRQATVTSIQRTSFGTVTRYTTDLSPGQSRTVEAGIPGQVLRTYLVTYRDGRQASKRLLSEIVLVDSTPAVVETGVSAGSSYVSPAGSGGAAAAVAAAYQALGTPYVNGGASLSGFDCSGLTMWAWAHGGVSLPHSAAAQYSATRRVSSSDLQPGDLVFFYSPISHVAIYVGGGMMIMAHKTGTVVQLDPMSSYWWSVYSGAGRP
jgi:cell wall-associated NlpC family hydrolase